MVTLLCFSLMSAMTMGIAVYIDSYSVHLWHQYTDIQAPPLLVSGRIVESIQDGILSVDGVVKGALLPRMYCRISRSYNDTFYEFGMNMIGYDSHFVETFPDFFNIAEGHPPTGPREVCLGPRMEEFLDAGPGDLVNLTLDHEDEPVTVLVVGTYTTVYESVPGFGPAGGYVLMSPDLYAGYWLDSVMICEVDRSPLTPFDARGSLNYLYNIDESIRMLDPNYQSRSWSELVIDDLLFNAVANFISWQLNARLTQLFRAGGTVVLFIMLDVLAIRYNLSERRREISMLLARGADRKMIERGIWREAILVTLGATLVGLLVGVLLSRVALASTGFLQIDPSLVFTEYLLVSLDSLIMAVITGVLLPLFSLFLYRRYTGKRESLRVSQGRLAKLVRGLEMVRWDVLALVLAGLLMFSLQQMGPILRFMPPLMLLLSILPLLVLAAVASLTVKGLRSGATALSHLLSPVFGGVPARVGIRRVGLTAPSAGAVATVLVLTVSLAWGASAVAATTPVTLLNQLRFATGADVAMYVEQEAIDQYPELLANTTAHPDVTSATVVRRFGLYLSTGYGGYTPFVGINATEFSDVGYDFMGVRLNESQQSELFHRLTVEPMGAIITTEIASAYDLEPGDPLRAYTPYSENASSIVFKVLGVVDALPCIPIFDPYGMYSWWSVAGSDVVCVNYDYVVSHMDAPEDAECMVCAAVRPDGNETRVLEELMDAGASSVVQTGYAAAPRAMLEEYMSSEYYHMDRAVDTMLMVSLAATIVSMFIVYAAEELPARRREMALLRAAGAPGSLVTRVFVAEMSVLLLVSLGLLVVFAPLFLSNLMSTLSVYYSPVPLVFPVMVFPVYPVAGMALVLVLLVVTALVAIAVIALYAARISLAEALNASWAEAGPYGGEL